MRRSPLPAWLALGLCLMAPRAWAFDLPFILPFWAQPALGPMREIPGLLTLPPSWMGGDAAAIILGGPPGHGRAEAQVAAALLAEGAAVLELDLRLFHGGPAEIPGLVPPEALLSGLFGALWHLRRELGSGLVVLIGLGEATEAVLAATPARAAAHLGQARDGFTALAALRPEQPVFLLASRPAPDQGWPLRAPLLCSALAVAMPLRSEAEMACLAALLPAAPAQALMLP